MTCITSIDYIGLTNILATLSILLNKIFYAYIDKFVVAYLDDIMAHDISMKKYVGHFGRF